MIDVEGIVPLGGSAPKKHILLEKSDKEDQQNSTQKTNFSRNSMNEAASVEGNGQMMPWFRAFLQSLKKWSDPKHHLPMYLQRCCLTHQIPPTVCFFAQHSSIWCLLCLQDINTAFCCKNYQHTYLSFVEYLQHRNRSVPLLLFHTFPITACLCVKMWTGNITWNYHIVHFPANRLTWLPLEDIKCKQPRNNQQTKKNWLLLLN